MYLECYCKKFRNLIKVFKSQRVEREIREALLYEIEKKLLPSNMWMDALTLIRN